jgi:hypothetical protein
MPKKPANLEMASLASWGAGKNISGSFQLEEWKTSLDMLLRALLSQQTK